MGNSKKIIDYILWALMGIGCSLTAAFYAGGIDETIILGFAYVLLAITAIAAVVFPIIILAQDPKKAKGALIAAAGLVIVFGIGYLMATNAIVPSYEKYEVTETSSKLVGMGLIATYVLMGLSGGGIIFFGIMGFFKS